MLSIFESPTSMVKNDGACLLYPIIRIHVCYIYIYGNIYHQYTPFMLAYIPAPWILWVLERNDTLYVSVGFLLSSSWHRVRSWQLCALESKSTAARGSATCPARAAMLNTSRSSCVAGSYLRRDSICCWEGWHGFAEDAIFDLFF